MARFGQAFAVSMGALIGGAFGFYLLEDYKIKAKVRDPPFFGHASLLQLLISLSTCKGATIGHVVGKETRIRAAATARKHINVPCAFYIYINTAICHQPPLSQRSSFIRTRQLILHLLHHHLLYTHLRI